MITTTLRVDPRLYDYIVKNAEKDKRSINSEILFILQRYVEMTSWYLKK